MAISSYKVGPGSLTLGSGPLNVSAQVLSCVVVPSESVETEDDINVLSGEVLEGEDTATLDYVLQVSFLQDLDTSGVVDYSWTNAGDEVAFVYIPNTVEDKQITGTLRLVPLSVGGTAKTRATSDVEWAIIGTPAFAAVP